MPYTETGAEKVKRKAYENKNRERALSIEKEKNYERYGTTEQNIPQVNPMGDVAMPMSAGMKKGGKVMKKTKKFDEGGRISDDIRERAMRSVANLTDEGDVSTITRNEYGDITPTLASMKKSAAQKTRVTPAAKVAAVKASKSEYDDDSPLPEMLKKSSVDELKNMVYSTSNKPSSFKDTGGNTRSKVSNASLSGLGFSKPRLYDPLAKFERKPEGMKSGGKVKSASKRADGCAIRGKTKA